MKILYWKFSFIENKISKNLLLVAISSIFFWLSISTISGFLERLVRDILLIAGVPETLVFLVSKVLYISLVIFGINHLRKLILNEKIADNKLFKTSIYLLIFGQLLSILNPFLIKLYPETIQDMNVLWSNYSVNVFSNPVFSITEFLINIFSYFYLAISFYNNKVY